MSERLPSPSPQQGSYGQFQIGTAQPPRRLESYDPQRAALMKYSDCIPKTEEQWQEARRRNGFQTSEDIDRTVLALVQDGSMRSDLRRFIYIAVCCVDHRKNEAEAYRKYRARVHSKDLTELTIRNYMSLVRGVIALMDELYPRMHHRAFEAVLLYGECIIAAHQQQH